jgi:Amt family ammonium transporter
MEQMIRDVWILVCTALVFFMQAGFCCLEAGTVRAKNSINVALKNVTDFLIATFCFFLVGYSIMFGTSMYNGLFGKPVFFLAGAGNQDYIPFLFQLVFCGTSATIVSGAVAERLRFLPYILFSSILTFIVYPIFGHWAWNSAGWLAKLGYHDFAGSSVVHMVGGFSALAGLIILGPRQGRFKSKGKPVDFPGSDIPMVALGTFILYFGWVGFNGGSAPFGEKTGLIILNTFLGGAFGGLILLLAGWAFKGVTVTYSIMNGILAGLVAITASADIVSPHAAALIGAAGAIVYYVSDQILLKFKIDDAVGAVPVHAMAGVTGVLLVAFFADSSYLDHLTSLKGITVDRFQLFQIQCLGVITCALWSFIVAFIGWLAIGKLTPLRVNSDEEQVGLNYSEHQVRNPVEELVSHLSSINLDQPFPSMSDWESSEYARLIAAVERIGNSLHREMVHREKESEWLMNDGAKLYAIIERCYSETLRQGSCLENIERKTEIIQDVLKKAQMSAGLKLVYEVFEGLREKLVELRAGHVAIGNYWEQLRDRSSSLLQHISMEKAQ